MLWKNEVEPSQQDWVGGGKYRGKAEGRGRGGGRSGGAWLMTILTRVVGVNLIEKMHLSKELKELRELAMR